MGARGNLIFRTDRRTDKGSTQRIIYRHTEYMIPFFEPADLTCEKIQPVYTEKHLLVNDA